MEKKFTDEEIVKAWEYCIVNCGQCKSCPYPELCSICNKDILDLINRQKAEIERLTEENNKLKVIVDHNCDPFPKWQEAIIEENAELQKQVDELTDKLGKVLSGIKADEFLVAKGIEQAVKDTAKEIADWLITTESDKEDLAKIIKEHYGVEVE